MDELREHYDDTDQAAALPDTTQDTTTGPVLVSTSIRLPKTLMAARATAVGVPATTLMRHWITARINAEHSSQEQVVSVADIRQLIATRAHPCCRLTANIYSPLLPDRPPWRRLRRACLVIARRA